MHLHPPRGSTIADRQKVSLIAPSFSTGTAIDHRQPLLTDSAQVVDGVPVSLPCAGGVVQRLGPVYSLVFPVQSTIDTHSMVSLHIFTQNGRFFRPRFLVCVVMGSDWLMAYSNNLLQPPPTFSPHRH